MSRIPFDSTLLPLPFLLHTWVGLVSIQFLLPLLFVVRIHIIIQHTLLTYHTHIHTQTHNMDDNIHKYLCTTTHPPSWWLGPSNFQVALYIFYMLYTFMGARIKRSGVMLPHC
jgi:hypothetical protein